MHKIMMTLVLAGACGLATCAQARADEIYTFTGNPPPADTFFAPKVQLEVTDAALAAGAIAVTGSQVNASPYNLLTGATGEFVSLNYVYFGSLLRNPSFSNNGDGSYAGLGSFSVNLGLGADGPTATPGTLGITDGLGDSLDVRADGGYSLVYDGGGSANSGCFPTACIGTGTWTAMSTDPGAVPEPASLAILGVGVFGLAAARRRRSSSPI